MRVNQLLSSHNFIDRDRLLLVENVVRELNGARIDNDFLISALTEKGLDIREAGSLSKSLTKNFRVTVSKSELLTVIANSRESANHFNALGVKGFSYSAALFEPSPILLNVRDSFSFRLCLFPEKSLFYPARVKNSLRRRLHYNHCKIDNFPSIAFLIAKIESNCLYISVIQSDVAYRTPSFFRGYFKGWRKVLVFEALAQARALGCDYAYIPRSKDVLKCCTPNKSPQDVPDSWRKIYERSASDFGFEKVKLEQFIDIQSDNKLNSVFAEEIYQLCL